MTVPEEEKQLTDIEATGMATPAVLAPATSGSGVLRMQFSNSRTGEAVIPRAILLDRVSIMTSALAGGVVAVNSPNGQRQLNVEAEGFLPFEARVTVDGENTLVQMFELDPDPTVSKDEETSVPEGMAEVSGTITDSDAGEALPGVRVSVTDPSAVSESGANGRYRLLAPTGTPRDPTKDPTGGLLSVSAQFAKAGYRTQRHESLMLSPGDRLRLNVRMDRITSETVDAEEPETVTHEHGSSLRRTSQWLFDFSSD
jgi:hypothetical protein